MVRIHFSFPSRTSFLPGIEALYRQFMSDFAAESGLCPDEIFLAVVEGVVNAVKHGNGEDPEKNVDVELLLTEEALHITIKDLGKGFCPETLADPTHPDNITLPGGRGIFLMKRLMDSVEYHFSPGQTVLEMKIACRGGCHGMEGDRGAW
ncbi:ATP-binding protein [Candidatus Mcinerneyibacteriota bacterium]|jgi:anti-sigma regulatory factor (Ser/Thr protein kinase)|nr:ATP-binding protein [Candidatus Mcinerneyibacteriota bacterium]